MWGMWHVWERGEVYTGFWWGDLSHRDYWEDVDVDGKIILKLTLSKCAGEAWTGLLRLRIWTVGGTCECGNEPSGSVKYGEFLD